MALRFSKLTRDDVRALKPGQRINEHGITADKLQNGDVRFSVNVMVDGQRIHRVVGRESDGVTRTQAEDLIEKLRTDARADRLNLPQGRKLHRTFVESAEEYITRMEASGGKDMANKKRHLRTYLAPHFGKMRLDKITEFELRKYRKARVASGATDATVNREFATLLHMLNKASSKDWRWMKAEDKPKIPRVREQRKARRALTPAEISAVMRGAIEDVDSRAWLFVALGFGTSMRHGEIVRRRYDEIDWNANRFEIGKAKAGARLQPFPLWVREALLRQREMEDDPEGWIFPAKRQHCKTPHVRSMDDSFRRAVVRAGLDPEKVTPHLMRHTVTTNLSRDKVDPRTLQELSGHKTIAMVMHYIHANDESIDLAAERIANPFSDTVTPELHTTSKPEPSRGASVATLSLVKSAG